MKKIIVASTLLAALMADSMAMGRPSQELLALTPPMGWNSFDSYGVYLHEEAAYANLEAMAEKLKPHGYEFFVIDNGWFGEYTLQEGTIFPAEKHAHDIRINEFGHFLPSKVYFPNGLKPIADRAHELGLKFGVHLMRGIPRKAVQRGVWLCHENRYFILAFTDRVPAECRRL
jgi:alpha-galactosidase